MSFIPSGREELVRQDLAEGARASVQATHQLSEDGVRSDRAVADQAPGRGEQGLIGDGGRHRLQVPELVRRKRRHLRRHPPGLGEEVRHRDPLLALDAELGNHLRHGGGELDLTAIDPGEYRRGGEGLGDGEEAEDVIGARPSPARPLGEADRLVEGDLAAPRHQHHGSVVALRADVGLDGLDQPLQAALVESQITLRSCPLLQAGQRWVDSGPNIRRRIDCRSGPSQPPPTHRPEIAF